MADDQLTEQDKNLVFATFGNILDVLERHVSDSASLLCRTLDLEAYHEVKVLIRKFTRQIDEAEKTAQKIRDLVS